MAGPWPTNTAGPGALVHKVYDGLRDEILSGRLKPGDGLSRLPIARRYGVSPTPVIEALVRLEQTGLVEAAPGQMARVRRVTLESIQNDYILREAIEVQTVRLACAAVTAVEIDELHGLATAVDHLHDEEKRGRPKRGAAADSAFHRRIAELSRCPVLVEHLDRIALGQHHRLGWIAPIAVEEPVRQHGLLADLIARRDVAAAEVEMRAHVRRGLEDECLAYQRRVVRK